MFVGVIRPPPPWASHTCLQPKEGYCLCVVVLLVLLSDRGTTSRGIIAPHHGWWPTLKIMYILKCQKKIQSFLKIKTLTFRIKIPPMFCNYFLLFIICEYMLKFIYEINSGPRKMEKWEIWFIGHIAIFLEIHVIVFMAYEDFFLMSITWAYEIGYWTLNSHKKLL